MRVLILGAKGFIGSNLTTYLRMVGYYVEGCDLIGESSIQYRNLSILTDDFKTYFTANNFDVCINAAGSGNVGLSLDQPLNDFDSNSFATFRILELIRKHELNCKYIHISSAAVYGTPSSLPICESSPTNPLSPYGYHKLVSEIICKEFNHIFRIPVVIVRPFSVYGNGLKKQLFWDICEKLNGNNKIELYGSGLESRDFIHINDVVQIFDLIIRKAVFTCEVFNIANGVETTINEVALIFNSVFGDKEIKFSGKTKIGDPLNWQANINKIDALGFKPKIQLHQGISDYIHWYLQVKNEY
jgi:UDP-glucose 4-epimerase